MEKIEVRKDLNDMVKKIKFEEIKNKYGIRHVCNVTLFNDKVIEFADKDDVYGTLESYRLLGEKDFIKSRELVELVKEDNEGTPVSKYICVRYILTDGNEFKLFASKYNANVQIDNYYKLYKQTHKPATKQG